MQGQEGRRHTLQPDPTALTAQMQLLLWRPGQPLPPCHQCVGSHCQGQYLAGVKAEEHCVGAPLRAQAGMSRVTYGSHLLVQGLSCHLPPEALKLYCPLLPRMPCNRPTGILPQAGTISQLQAAWNAKKL